MVPLDSTIGNQAFNHDRCSTFPRLNYSKANNTFFISLRKNGVESQVEFTLKVMEGLGSSVIDVTVKKHVLKVFRILAGVVV